jgi:hypothetical protein
MFVFSKPFDSKISDANHRLRNYCYKAGNTPRQVLGAVLVVFLHRRCIERLLRPAEQPVLLPTAQPRDLAPDSNLIDFPVGRNSAKIGIRITENSNFLAPLAQLAEQVTLNCARSEVIRPALPNTLRKFRVCWVTRSNQRQDSLQNGPNVRSQERSTQGSSSETEPTPSAEK